MAQLEAIAGEAGPINRWSISAYLQISLGLCLVVAAIVLLAADSTENGFVAFFLALFGQMLAAARSNALGWTKEMEREPSPKTRRAARYGKEASLVFAITAFLAAIWPLGLNQPIVVMPYTLFAAIAVFSALRNAVASAYLIWFSAPPPPDNDFW